MKYVLSLGMAVLMALVLAMVIGPPKADMEKVAQFENCVSIMGTGSNYDKLIGDNKSRTAKAISTACGWYELSHEERVIVLDNIKKAGSRNG
mgnify:CR=1 FL=1